MADPATNIIFDFFQGSWLVHGVFLYQASLIEIDYFLIKMRRGKIPPWVVAGGHPVGASFGSAALPTCFFIASF
jgi:hypothetical protein